MKYDFRSFNRLTGETLYTEQLMQIGALYPLLQGQALEDFSPLDFCIAEARATRPNIYARDILTTEQYPTRENDKYYYVILPGDAGYEAVLVRKEGMGGGEAGTVHPLSAVLKESGRVTVVGNLEQDVDLILEQDLEICEGE
ncbi:hypothetical protein [Paenibacillus bovis]|uniref:Uncharacterized protein n=1 Tax=Paenibacillus bovis TaxID=1616788 RepID=A0A1X9T3Y0_9BACL|nr:hypothetical protein [Paenibacillus bovis]ARR10667.1 hypothetical protein AR543_p0059 [Paenibacillus bovis]